MSKKRPDGFSIPNTLYIYDECVKPELTPDGKPKREMYPIDIARMLSNGIVRRMVARFYQSVGDMVIDELERDLNMTANHFEANGKKGLAHTHRMAARHVREMRKSKLYPSEVKFG